MGYIVVQWKNENSVSVVNEKQVVGAVALKEGRTVNVSAGTTKGRVAVYEATVLKVCATKSQALEFEKSLLTPAAVETKGDEKRKRPRKPSQKVKENFEGDLGKDQEEDVDNDKDQISQKKRRMNKKGKDADKEEEKRRETDTHKRTPLTDHNSHKTLQNAPITPRQVLDLDTYETPLSHRMSPSFTELLNLVDDECENVPLVDSPAPPKTIGNSNWESFASHFTQEFEWLKAEVDGLRNEVKNLRRTVRELKANSSSVHGNAGLSASQPQQTQENQLLEMVKNTTKPLEGLKTILYELFTPDEVRQSSLKGRTTVTGGESIGLQRQKLDLVYCVMESRYKMDRLPVDNLIRGQQRKLRAQQKKTNSS